MLKRILVTGSRDLTNRTLVEMGLEMAVSLLGEHQASDIVLVHGDCKRYLPDGSVDLDRSADQLAAQSALRFGWQVEPHGVTDAEYRQHGDWIFGQRNQEMVDLGADICVVYPGGNGTADCSRRAHQAGIKRIVLEDAVTPDRC